MPLRLMPLTVTLVLAFMNPQRLKAGVQVGEPAGLKQN
jgi:hypothetical protein